MKKIRTILSLLLTVMLMSAMFIVPASAESGVFTDTCTWPPMNSFIANKYSANGIGWQIDAMTHEGMFALVAVSGTVYNRLCTEYEQDEYTDTFHLRQDVKYNDGEPFTAKDIWSYYILNNTTSVSQQLKSIEIVDDYTIKMTWREKLNPSVRLHLVAANVDANIPYHIFSQFVDTAWELIQKGVETDNEANRRAFGLEYDEETLAAMDANWQAFILYGPEDGIPVGTGSYMVS
ncbi:MAG: hypothetical protein E7317_13010, partial [Clostridiales bacterium]|nr:hypothetical protein [Clostridiales bacterium]